MASEPTNEIGNANAGMLPWDSFGDSTEDVAALAWPQSIHTFNKIRTDDQASGLLDSFTLPIRGYEWYIDPNGASDEATEHTARDLGLPIQGEDEPTGRLKGRFSFDEYLFHCLLKLPFGFIFFEQVYRYGEEDRKFHIRKLAPRMPGSIQQVETESDGGLKYIKQWPDGRVGVGNNYAAALQAPLIPVDRLVAHVHDKEAGNWYGRSMLRSVYKPWLTKDRLMRVDAIKHERNGLGVPTGKTTEKTTKEHLDRLLSIVTRWKSGDTAGAALPPGTDIELKGVQGSLPDTLASIKYYDQAMARRFLAMFTQLGTTESGSRALAETFVDFFALAQQSVAKSIADVTTAHVIEDLIDINFSISENAPRLRFRTDPNKRLAIEGLVALIDAGGITVDDATEQFLRREYNMPPLLGRRPVQPLLPPTNRVRERITMAADEQRKPTEVEKDAKADFAAMRKTFDAALDGLLASWVTDIKARQVGELMTQIAALSSDDVEALTAIAATPVGANLLNEAMTTLVDNAAARARSELEAQGVAVDEPDLAEVKAQMTRRAESIDKLLAAALSQSAATKALSEAGGTVSSLDIAQRVGDHLNELSDASLKRQLGAALMTSQNKARVAVFDGVAQKRIYASELNDGRRCRNCRDADGTEYTTMADALEDYPSGGYWACEGGPNCRGTLICVAETEEEPAQ